MSYGANAAGEVKKYTVVTTWSQGKTVNVLTLSGTYPAAKLYKTQVMDEDGQINIEYKNKKGQLILLRKNGGAQNLDTYTVYNEFGHKVFIISPSASVSGLTDDETLNKLCYQYRYDGWNRLVEKRLPGKDWEYIVYDKADRVVATKDSQNPWIFSKYDQLGRVVYTGLADLGDRAAVQSALNNLSGSAASNNETKSSSSFTHSGMQIYYSNSAYPTNIISVLSVNYYDTYPTGSPGIPSQILNQDVLSQDAQNSAISTKSLTTASYVKNIDNDNWTKNYIWYDQKGRVLGTHSINHLGGYTKTESQLDFAGVPQQSVVKHKRLNSDTEKVITQTFTYDDQNRLLVHKHQVNNHAEEILAQNIYNELSQITSKKVGGISISTPLQTVDYSYNIRGWVTGVNNPNNLGNDLFGYTLKYQDPDNSEGRYNGNISEIDWKKNNVYAASSLRRYSFYYDNVNRLAHAVFSEPASTVPQNEFYNESAEYDVNGNITWLARNAPSFNGLNANQIDDLHYQYQGNQLESVEDKSGNLTGYEGGSNTIAYDDNGNMTTMPDKMIDQIDYNFLNLPTQFNINGNHKNISYSYRADGTKLRKNFIVTGDNNQSYASSTEYLDGFQYASSNGDELWALFQEAGGGAYEPEAYSSFLNVYDYSNVLKFVPTAEGFYDFENNQYIYQYKDHLGNVRVSYKKDGNNLVVTDSNDYYPFGMSFVRNAEEEAIFSTGSYANYKYNSKELQETGMYDYGWRHYMADLGRWNGIDQLAEMYQSTSTYAYVANNPVMRFDVDGRWFNDDGTIDTSGYTPRFTTAKQYRDSFLGINRNDGGGGAGGSLWVGDITADNGITVGDLIDAWLENNSTDYFEGIDFTQFEANDCCPDLAIELAKGFTISAGTVVTTIGVVAQALFSSAHIPEYAGKKYLFSTTGSFSVSDVKAEAKSSPVRERMGQVGSYTIIFDKGYKYHGKGPIDRMFTSALFQMGVYRTTVKSFDWTPSITDREAFKAEYRRMQRDQVFPQYPEGYMNPINYNKIQSPGYLYMLQDGY
ncbi:RHS repeat-associated core domain-containing protein [Chryseobacterium sp. 2R14A]|uniref:RHS repeat protein n=1 Tax=Chryseobacterium sp. 2R14A TaxID=3380353 RepID=UPI003CF90461